MYKFLRIFLVFFVIGTLWGCGGDDNEPEPPKPPVVGADDSFSGVWITSVASSVLNSRENIRQAVDVCSGYGINNIFVVVWNKGRTHYPSKIMKNLIGVEIAEQYAGRDPLQEMIEEAHKKNIKVHAWFEYGFAASNSQNGGLILQKKPEWAAKDVNGNLLSKNGFEWMNPFLPEVQNFMTSLILEVINSYDVDGVQGDDRLPALPSTGGYDDYTKELYKKAHDGFLPPNNYADAEWVNWRTNLLTEYLGELYKKVKEAKSDVIVSCAPSVHPWAKNEYLQDWPSWLSKGYTDMVIPQHYRYDIDAYQTTLQQQLSYLQSKDRKKFYPGLLIQNGTYNPTEEFLKKMIEINRRNGITGEAFWFYEGLSKFSSFFNTYRK